MELLSPAGHWEAMVAAVQNGADSVYLGLGSCNARRGARNFTVEEFPRAVEYCHLRGVRLYLTVNTLLSDRELSDAGALLRLASRSGADGVIIQDWGAAALARKITPDLPLHGSTQMTLHSLEGVERAAELGLRCAVLSRELSREDIRFICAHSPIQIEVFAHGALCMCYSGQCAMSALIGQRSGNRGLCAQPCRLPYRMDGGRNECLLSLKDASLASHLAELEDMGVSILKLEGRMKRPEYVAAVTRIYAGLLREKRPPTAGELEELERAFSRQGFTDAYWQGKPGPHMFGTRPRNAQEPTELFQALKDSYEREDLRLVPVRFSARIAAGEPARVTVRDPEGRSAEVRGPVPEAARSRPLEAEEVKARLAKTGGTPFRAEVLEAEVEPGLSLPASAVNALRREALERLSTLRICPPRRREKPAPGLPDGNPYPEAELTVSLYHPSQLTEELAALLPAIVYLPAERWEEFDPAPLLDRGIECCAALPRVCKDSEAAELRRRLERARGCGSLAVQNLGQLPLGEELGLPLRGDFGLNVFNSLSLAELKRWGLKSAAVSFELRWEQLRDLRKCLPCEAIVYGRLPLMITENCLIANRYGCASHALSGPCRKPHSITDRKGEVFPVLPAFGCRSEVQNSKRLFLADKPEYRRCGLRYARLRFTTEGPRECVRVLERYLGRNGDGVEDYTRGLFYRGVE